MSCSLFDKRDAIVIISVRRSKIGFKVQDNSSYCMIPDHTFAANRREEVHQNNVGVWVTSHVLTRSFPDIVTT